MWIGIELSDCCREQPKVYFDDEYFETETDVIYIIECSKCKKATDGISYLDALVSWNNLNHIPQIVQGKFK